VIDATALGLHFEVCAALGGADRAEENPGAYHFLRNFILKTRNERRAEENRARRRERAGWGEA
jgi:hypothetical protein